MDPSVAIQLTVGYQTGISNSTYQPSTTIVSFTIGANGITYLDGVTTNSTTTVPTSANVDASDLADAINYVLKAQGLHDVVAVVDRGANGMLDKNPQGLALTDPNYPITQANRDRLAFAATTKSVTRINISNAADLGFGTSFTYQPTAYQPLDPSSTAPTSLIENKNPAWKDFKFRGQSDAPVSAPIPGQPAGESEHSQERRSALGT